MLEILKFRRNWAKARAPLALPVENPPSPKNNGGTCILYLGEVALLIPAVKALMSGPVDSRVVAKIHDTLGNSAIVPPPPWPQVPHRFEYLITIPSVDAKGEHCYVPAVVLHPL
jgi:hypothetical protein